MIRLNSHFLWSTLIRLDENERVRFFKLIFFSTVHITLNIHQNIAGLLSVVVSISWKMHLKVMKLLFSGHIFKKFFWGKDLPGSLDVCFGHHTSVEQQYIFYTFGTPLKQSEPIGKGRAVVSRKLACCHFISGSQFTMSHTDTIASEQNSLTNT